MSTNLAPMPGNLPTTPGAFGGTAPFAGATGGPRTSPLVRYIAAIKRFKWLVLLLTLVGLGGGYLTSRLRPASYVVNSTVMIADASGGGAGAIAANPLYSSLQWKELFSDYSILQPVAVARRLYIHGPKKVGAPPPPAGPSGPYKDLFNNFSFVREKFVPGSYEFKIAKDGKTWELNNSTNGWKTTGSVGDSVGQRFGFLWLPRIPAAWYGENFSFDVITPREAADDIKDHLNIAMDWRAARFMHITFTGTDADQAAGTLNDLMAQFVNQASAMKKMNLTANADTLAVRVAQAQQDMKDIENKLQSFKVKTITMPREDLPVAPGLAQTTPSGFANYISKRDEVAELRKERTDLVNDLALADSGKLVVDLLMQIPAVRTAPEFSDVVKELQLQQARLRSVRDSGGVQRLDTHPAVKAVLDRIDELQHQTIPQYARVVLSRLNLDIARGDSAIRVGESELKGIPARTIEEARLERDRDLQEKLLGNLMERYQQARLAEAGALSDVSIMAPAEPPLKPTRNRAPVLIALGAIVGLAGGLGLAFFFDVTDKRVRYADQITGGLGLTILGVIPEIRRAKGEAPTAEEAAQVIEAFRTVRLNLSHTAGDGPLVLTISSPSPGDGKSLVSSNLALSFAEAGYRTLLIDGDTRRGELHRTFGVDRRPGLLDYLTGELPLSELRRPTSHPQLALIPGGSRKRNAPELLGTSMMRELVTTMRAQYDVVLIDSPPLGAGIDPFVLGTLTGNLMLVVRAGATERDLAEAKLQIVDQLPIRLIGAVLNDVRATMNEYKYYSYSYGYGAVDEGEERGKLPAVLGSSGTDEGASES